MAHIKILKDNELIGGRDNSDVYPVSSTQAIFSQMPDGSIPPGIRHQRLEERLQDHESLLAELYEMMEGLIGGNVINITVEPSAITYGATTTVNVSVTSAMAVDYIKIYRNASECIYDGKPDDSKRVTIQDTVIPDSMMPIRFTTEVKANGITKTAEKEVTINKGAAPISWSKSSDTVNIKDAASHHYPLLDNPSNLPVTYTSSNSSVASIHASTGVITLQDIAGTATIKAVFAGDERYNAAEASYILTVSKENAGLTYSQETVGILTTDTQQQIQAKLPTLSSQHPVSDIEFSSTNMNVATIDSAGHVTVIGTNNLDSNSTEISASVPASNPYYEGSASYLLTVSKVSAPISWSAQSANGKIGETYVGPALSNDENLTIVYQSTNPNVATINSSTGVVTLVGEGTTTIKARFAGNNIYKDTTKSYTLNVTREIVPAYIGAGTSYSAVAVDANKVIDYTGEKTYSIPVTSGDNIYIIVPQGVTYSAFMGGQPMGLASEGTVTINGNVYDVKHTIPFGSTSTKTFKLIYD